ncbi:hypothetical protein HN51_047008 [Arachis hypogaea]
MRTKIDFNKRDTFFQPCSDAPQVFHTIDSSKFQISIKIVGDWRVERQLLLLSRLMVFRSHKVLVETCFYDTNSSMNFII